MILTVALDRLLRYPCAKFIHRLGNVSSLKRETDANYEKNNRFRHATSSHFRFDKVWSYRPLEAKTVGIATNLKILPNRKNRLLMAPVMCICMVRLLLWTFNKTDMRV